MAPPKKSPEGPTSPKIPFGEGDDKQVSDGPRVLFGAAASARIPSGAPRIVGGGSVRRRISCSPSDLRAFDERSSDDVVIAAQRVIEGINLDDDEFGDVVSFGSEVQLQHGSIAERQLALVNDRRVVEANRLSQELLQHLEALKPEEMFPVRTTLLASIASSFSGPAKIERYREEVAEISKIAQSIAEITPRLVEMEHVALSLKKRWRRLTKTVDAYLLAGRFIVAYIDTDSQVGHERSQHYRSQKDALETRIGSLAATSTSLVVGLRTLEAIYASLTDARSFAEELVARDLPAWQTAVGAAIAARTNDPSAPIELNDITRRYLKLVTMIKRKEFR